METITQYKYFAFISYNSHDIALGKRLQRKLESYRMSATLCSEHGWQRKPINPVFFAPYDIQPGGLSQEIQDRLNASRHLIVICSPHSAKSEWVGKEIEYFHQLGRTKNIHFFIVEGEPHSGNPDTECFNPIVETLGLPEILGANIHEQIFRWSWLNKERAYVQLISKLLGVEFDAIWQRHKRLLIGKSIAWAIGIVCVLSAMIGVYVMNQPIDVRLKLNEVSYLNTNLPPLRNAEVVLKLQNEEKRAVVVSLDSFAVFKNIPSKFLDKKVQVHAHAKDYLDVDTTVFLSENLTIDIHRNPSVYGDVHFQIWDEDANGVPHVDVSILSYKDTSTIDGYVSLFIPLEEQRDKYHVASSVPLQGDTIYMPCGENDILIIK